VLIGQWKSRNMRRRRMHRLVVIILWATALSSAAAHADSIDITLLQVNQSGVAGTTVTFDATLTNLTGSTIFINGGTATTSTSFLTVDDNPFLNNAPLALASGARSGPFPLFSVFISPGTPLGNYGFNTFSILGGTSSTAFNSVGSAQFNVTVAPEPGTMLLLSSGLIGLGIKLRLKKYRKPQELTP
jgi:hypothetical protein